MAITAAVETGVPGYLGWLTIRITPFSVNGQVAQEVAAHSWNHR
jgi:hypothetical protein